MNKTFFNLFLVVSSMIMGSVYAEEGSSIEIRFSELFPTSHKFREIYGKAHPSFGIEASQNFCECFNGWVDLDFLSWSKSKRNCCKTKINVLNGSVGPKCFISLSECLEAYLGLGVSLSAVNLKNRTLCEKQRFNRLAVGAIFKSGVQYPICDSIYLDLFVDYLYLPLPLHGHVDIGGVKTGLGLGAKF